MKNPKSGTALVFSQALWKRLKKNLALGLVCMVAICIQSGPWAACTLSAYE